MISGSSSSNQVLIEKLEVEASIGVFDWEKQIKQRLVFDLILDCNFSLAAKSDAIEDAVDYAAVCEEVERITLTKHYELLECLADTIVEALLTQFNILAIDLKISKPGAVPQANSVGVRVTRSRDHLDA